MRRLPKPTDDPGDVFQLCISRVRDAGLKRDLESVVTDVEVAARDFDIAAASTALHTLTPSTDIRGIVTQQQMKAVYTQRMAKKGAPGRSVYEKLLSTPRLRRCPLCGQRTVSTLDHHLPKAEFPALVVVPINLVPACSDCNKNKIDSVPASQDAQTIHPYYDDFDDEQWIFAEVIEDSPVAVRFHVRHPSSWNNIKTSRAKKHFETFKLAELYASYAGEELINIQLQMTRLFNAGGADAVREDLTDREESHKCNHVNSWQIALYQALASSDWYCEGGFL